MNTQLPRNIIRFVILVLIQVLILNNIQFTRLHLNPLVYTLFVLLLPFNTPLWLQLAASFLLGLTVDIFSDTLGMHSSATVLLAFLRPFVLEIIAPREGYEVGKSPQLSTFGLGWFLKYSLILIVAHHTVYFLLDAFDIHFIHILLLKIGLTTIFSTLIIVISQFFVFK